MISSLEQSILSALVYFDMFDYPLTLMEVHRYLLRAGDDSPVKQYTLGEVQSALADSTALQKIVRFKNGWFYLRGREPILRGRAERYIAAANKYRRARRAARVLSHVPFVRLIAVCNSLSYNNARVESDIDLFIATKQSGIWWVRGLALLILKILRARPGQGGFRDKICLSFFVDDSHLNLKPLQAGSEDIYFPVWLAALYPLYDAGQYYQRAWQANDWMKEYLSNARALLAHPGRVVGGRPFWRFLIELPLAPFNRVIGYVQSQFFPAAIRSLINTDTRVRVEPGVLKFHTNDRRQEYAQKFQERLAAFYRIV